MRRRIVLRVIADAAAAVRGRIPIRYSAIRWVRAYRRVVRDSFRTVPFYRESWALGPGSRVIARDEAQRRIADLIPLGGGAEETDDRRSYRAIARFAVDVGAAHGRTGRSGVLAVAAMQFADPDSPLVPGTLFRDPLFGYLGVVGDCGFWHLPWPQVYARRTERGTAVTLLQQRSPRLVDLLLPGSAAANLSVCVRHGCPVLTA